MSARLRILLIALLLGAVAGAAGVVSLLIKNDSLPLAHRVTDLRAHFAALDQAEHLGIAKPWYDRADISNPNLGIVEIDDLTYGSNIPQLHQFPFARSVYGTLLKRLADAGAKVVVFDIDFLDPAPVPSYDTDFAAGMRKVPTVLAYTVNTTSRGQIGIQPPAPTLLPAAAATGYTTVDEPGGILTGQPMQIQTSGKGTNANETFDSLAAAAAQLYEGKKLELDSIPTDENGAFVLAAPRVTVIQSLTAAGNAVQEPNVSFAGRGVISFSDAYSESMSDLRQFAKGALIYVGDTAQAEGDYVQTAREANTPGLFTNARFADQLMRGIHIVQVPLWIDIGLILLLPLLVALSFSLLRTPVAILAALVATLAYAYINSILFIDKLIWVDLVHVIMSMTLATLFVGLYRVLYEGAQRRMVTNLFGMHVSPAIVKDILDNDDPKAALALKGKKVTATIFYSDIRGFTAMSETMTPEEIYTQLNEYFEEMCAIIFQYGGYVDKFIGDCVMAVFSAPYQTPDDPRNAIISAVKQQEKIRELSERWKAEGKREFTVGMGLNTGDVVMGNLGASSRMNYTVIGDNVNLAARLYNVAKAGEIIISDYTYQEVKDIVVAEEREPVMVKGKKDPIKIYNITGLKENAVAATPSTSVKPEPAPA